jgi:hypothetical protein
MHDGNTLGRPRSSVRARIPAAMLGVALLILVAALATAAAAAPSQCGICAKNLIKNPGAESGRGVTAVGAFGAVPGWTIEGGQFGAASYAFPNGWFSARSQGPKNRGKNYFFGGTSEAAIRGPASIGTQTIALPAAAVGRKATLSGWLGNYSKSRAQVRAVFTDAAGATLSTVRIGPVVTTGGTDMVLRSRFGTVPARTTQVKVSVNFGPNSASYNLAGADSLSLVLS